MELINGINNNRNPNNYTTMRKISEHIKLPITKFNKKFINI